MLYLICTMISSVGLAHNGVARAKDWVSVDCGTSLNSAPFFRSPVVQSSFSFMEWLINDCSDRVC